jgi:inner membrane protein
MALSALPDIDVIGYWLDIRYGHVFGHRGITHSLFFALLLSGIAAAVIAQRLKIPAGSTWAYFFTCMASHGIIDAFTNGGRGIAFFAPFHNDRYFFPLRPVQVSVLEPDRFFSEQWPVVLASELLWIWLPVTLALLAGYLAYRRKSGD